MKPGIFVAVHRHALVGVADRRVAEAVEHGVAVGGQVDRAGAQAGNGVVGDVVERQLADLGVVRALVDVEEAGQRAGPGDAASGR